MSIKNDINITDNCTRRPSSNVDGKKLTVGREIHLSGEIGSCDIMIIEGHVEAQIKECTRLEIAHGGAFIGSAQVNEAEISGKFNGSLNAKHVILMRTAEISGKLIYGSLEVQTGAQIKGEINYIKNSEDERSRFIKNGPITLPRKSSRS